MAQLDRQPVAQFKFPRFRLVWSPKAVPEAKWRLGLVGFYHRGMPKRWWIVLSTRGTLAWGSGLAAVGFFASTAALAYLWGRNPYNYITYADLVLPTRWSDLRHKRGLGMVDEGIHDFRAGKYPSALMLLSHGIALAPEADRGRYALATLYTQIGLLHRAQTLLEEGLETRTPNKAHRELLFKIANYLENYDQVIVLTEQIERLLPPNDLSNRRWLLIQKVHALEKLKKYDELDALRKKYELSPFFALETAWARAQAAQGNAEQALNDIVKNPEKFGLPADRYQLQLEIALQAHDTQIAHQSINEWIALDPTQSTPRIQQIIAAIRLEDTPQAEKYLNEFFIFFGAQSAQLVSLFRRINDLGRLDWIHKVYAEAVASGSLSMETRIFHIQGLLLAGDAQAAEAELKIIQPIIQKSKIEDGGWTQGTAYLLGAILHDSPSNRSLLLSHLRNQRLNPDVYRFVITSLLKANANELAIDVNLIARNRFPNYQLDSFASAALQQTKQPTKEAAPSNFRSVMSARLELAQVDTDLERNDFDRALQRLAAIERAGYPELRGELLLSRIRIYGSRSDQQGLARALQLYLAESAIDFTKLRQFAESWKIANIKDSAQNLARAVKNKQPQATWTDEFLAESSGDAQKVKFVPNSKNSSDDSIRRILSDVRTDLKAGRFSAAAEKMSSVRPPQDKSLQAEFFINRIQVHGYLNELTELDAMLGAYLSGNSINQSELRSIAEQWIDNQNNADSALLLLKRVSNKFPQARWAVEMKQKIEGDLMVAPEKE